MFYMKKITDFRVFEPKKIHFGAEISFSTPTSRKSFHLPRPKKSSTPLAIESFAQDPEQYFQFMDAIESFYLAARSKKKC